MTFVRPEVQALLWKWRELLSGVALIVAGIWLVTVYGGLFFLFGCVFLVLGTVQILVGYRRAQFPAAGGGAGVVDVDERLITYFGPEGGAAVALDDLAEVEIITSANGSGHEDLFWKITDTLGTVLVIPGGAENVASLFDALSPLNGFDWDALARASSSSKDAKFVIWKRASRALH